MPAEAHERVPGPVWSNPQIVDAAAGPCFSPEECDVILEATAGAEALGGADWVGERLAQRVASINEEVYRFATEGLENPIRVTRDRGGNTADPGLACDLSEDHPGRKLSFLVLLSDPTLYEGGDLTFATGALTAARRRGVITVFPSFLFYAMTPVTSGERVALVGYATGPPFA